MAEKMPCPKCGKVTYSFLHSCPFAGLSDVDARFAQIVAAEVQAEQETAGG